MLILPNTQAILLLTSYFSKSKEDMAKPLTPKEWGRFAVWLREKQLTPEDLMTGRLDHLLQGWSDKKVTLQRVELLLDRGAALGLAMEKWLRSGLWVLTRSDPDYPQKLKQRLGNDSPAVLFGCGNRSLLNGGGLAVVGSRHTSESDLDYSQKLGAMAAENGKSIVSGGARGVDEAAMLGALEVEGTVIGVLANSLFQASSSARYRRHLMENNLLLVSPFYPDAGFYVGNAMQRNKYIYCLSDAAMVVHSGIKGGTWTGAKENLKKCWVPLWVKKTDDESAGNAAIVDAGGSWVSSDIGNINFLDLFTESKDESKAEEDLFASPAPEQEQKPVEVLPESQQSSSLDGDLDLDTATDMPSVRVEQVEEVAAENASDALCEQINFYAFFLIKAKSICSDAPKTAAELADRFAVNKTQINAWLKQALADEKMQKLVKPVRYEWHKQEALPL